MRARPLEQPLVTEGDNLPTLTWILEEPDPDNVGEYIPVDVTNATVTLVVYENAGTTEPAALWSKVLDPSDDPTDGSVTYTPDADHPYYPAQLIASGGGTRNLMGDLHFVDATISADLWISEVWRYTVRRAPSVA